jgi:CheY-like chemotaxis protein
MRFARFWSTSWGPPSSSPRAGAFRVSDTGPGIDPAKQVKLFQRFSQIDGSLSRDHTGAGLGLAICKGLVEAMGGAISVQSAQGEGATFAFSIPAPVTAAAIDAQRAGPITGARILIVDDNASARDVVVAALTNAGAIVVEAGDGRSGLECAIQAPFDLILLDIRMSGVGGAEVASILRSRRGPNRNAPIIAFTAEGEGAGAGDLQQQGFDGLLRKPVSIETLLGVVGSFVQA